MNRLHRVFSIQNYAFLIFFSIAGLLSSQVAVHAQVNQAGQQPYLGWSTYSEQTINGSFLTQANVMAQTDALRASGLQAHGFEYINIDSGWQGLFDANGRPIPNPATFPDIKALIDRIHANGQKAGIYWIPGIEQPAVDGNFPILGTPYHTQDIVVEPLAPGNAFAAPTPAPYHDKIEFTKPGAQAYINSIVDLFASWGVDFIKLDGVTLGSDVDNLSIDNRPDVEAWSKAIAQSGRRMWLTISWDLDQDYLSTWQQYSNARRVDQDVECEGGCSTLTDWPRIVLREYELVGWEHDSGPSKGWNDLDTLDVGDGATDGLSAEEKQSAITLWAMANAPMYLGGELTSLDDFAKSALSNDELLAIDQSGYPATQARGGVTPVWVSDAGDGYEYVALFNLNAFPTRVTVKWSSLGFANAADVRDVWNRIDLGRYPGGFSAVLLGHGSRLLKVRRQGSIAEPGGEVYDAESGILSGAAVINQCAACSGGALVGYLGGAPNTNTVTFNNVYAGHAGTYRMEVDYLTQGPRALVFSVNDGPSVTLNLGGGSFNLPAATTVAVTLVKGFNTITFGNPGTYAADLDRIVISGNGDAVPVDSITYEAEAASLSGSASVGGCSYCSGGAYVGSFGAGAGNNVTFNHVIVPKSGTYQLEVDYTTQGPRTFFATVNDAAPIELDLNGSTFSAPASIVITVQLQAGENTISFGNPNPGGYAPGLDSITVGPVVNALDLSGAITRKTGADISSWQLTLRNGGTSSAVDTIVNRFTFVPASGSRSCKVSALRHTPFSVGTIAPLAQRSVEVPIAFSPGCEQDDTFALQAVFSASNGAVVGTLAETGVTQ